MRSTHVIRFFVLSVILSCFVPTFAHAQGAFVNFESPHVHPIDMSPDGSTLAVCNTPDNHIWFYDITGGIPVLTASVPVGIDPISVRFRDNNEAWVVNHVSDSVSIVDVPTRRVSATVSTRIVPSGAFVAGQEPADFGDEPTDVVFAGSPLRAYISCSQSNRVLIVDPADPSAGAIDQIPILGEEPRAMAVSADGLTVYVAIFQSGNGSTILGGGADLGNGVIDEPPNVVDDGGTPHGGLNPPPNDGILFDPPQNGGNPAPPAVGLIVRKSGAAWIDDNGGDWADVVDGVNAAQSGRPVGWNLIDNDIAIIDTAGPSVTYATELMNICTAIAVNPLTDEITLVGTDGTNHIRFEPFINGKFSRVNIGVVDATTPSIKSLVDLNGAHLDYLSSTIAQSERDKSLGDPRGIVWSSTGVGYVTGMGSNNLIVIDQNGARAGLADTIEVGEGPTGVALDEAQSRLYVLNKFDASISVVDTTLQTEIARVPFFDPTPSAIQVGRKHLYDTHKNSGLGHIACASCHIDSRMDGLAWDLGAPDGAMKSVNGADHNLGAGIAGLGGGFSDFHPMKGPMTTQTLRDIIGKEPLHWRGDRDGLEEFNGAFMGLQGDDTVLTVQEMQEYEDFLATIHFPPNPFRNLDNTLPTNLPLPGHFETGKFGVEGSPLPNGDAVTGLSLYRDQGRNLDSGVFTCVECHTFPIGNGPDTVFNGDTMFPAFAPIALGPNGENHVALVSVDGSTNKAIKIPQLRSSYEKVGFEMTVGNDSRSGFGFLHDGSVDSLARFVSEVTFTLANTQEVADLVALMLAFSGGFDFVTLDPLEFPMQDSLDAHAAVGAQVTTDGNAGDLAAIAQLVAFAATGDVDLIGKGLIGANPRGWYFVSGTTFQSDRLAQVNDLSDFFAKAGPGNEVTFTVVPPGTGLRSGIDRDMDGVLDFDEVLQGSNPLDPNSKTATNLPLNVPIIIVIVCAAIAVLARRFFRTI